MKYFVVWFGISFSTLGAWAMEVIIPPREAATLARFFPNQTPDRGFTCNVPVKFLQNVSRCDFVCERNPCISTCSPATSRSFLVQAEGCETDQIEIVSTLSWIATVEKSVPTVARQTWLTEFLRSADFFIVPSGTLEIDYVFPVSTLKTFVDESGDEQQISVATLLVKYVQVPGGASVQFEIHLHLGKTGVEQLLYFGEPRGSARDFFFKQWGYVR